MTNDCGCENVVIPTGRQGRNGLDGQYGGYSTRYQFNASAGTVAPSNFLAFNNATYSAVTIVTTNIVNSDNVNVAALLDNAPLTCYVRIFKEFSSDIFWLGVITAIATSGSTRQLTVSYIMSNGTFAANDKVVISFSPGAPIKKGMIVLNSGGFPNDVAISSGTSFLASVSTVLKPALALNLKNSDNTSQFSYDATTGIVTVINDGYYNINIYMYIGALLSPGVWGAGFMQLGVNHAGADGDMPLACPLAVIPTNYHSGTATIGGGGTVVVSTNKVLTASKISLTYTSAGTADLLANTIVNATSFTITGTAGATVDWVVFNSPLSSQNIGCNGSVNGVHLTAGYQLKCVLFNKTEQAYTHTAGIDSFQLTIERLNY